MTASLILAVNGGSSSLKCGLFSREDPSRSIQDFNLPNPGGEPDSLVDCLNDVLQQVSRHDRELSAIGHRVVHGGNLFDGPVVVNDKVLMAEIDYATQLWQEKELKSVANVTAADIQSFLLVAAEAGIKPEVETYPLEAANQALRELRAGHVRGAKVLEIGA